MEKIRIMIVDDHPLFRQGLRRVLELEDDFEVESEVADGQEALRVAKKLIPDVVVMDIQIPSMNGLQVTRQLKGSRPEVAVIILTAYHSSEQRFHTMRAGASAYYAKEVRPAELVRAIRLVHQGDYIVEDNVLNEAEMDNWLLEQSGRFGMPAELAEEMFAPLSPREVEILQHIARGRSNKEIAYTLGISRQTVKNHVTSILRKLGVNDRTQAAVYALRHGWIRLQDTESPPLESA